MIPIDARIDVLITHVAGPEITDRIHILSWLVGGHVSDVDAVGDLTLLACPLHADPEVCDCGGPDQVVTQFSVELITAT